MLTKEECKKLEICQSCGKKEHPCYDICRENAVYNYKLNLNNPDDKKWYCDPCPECESCCN